MKLLHLSLSLILGTALLQAELITVNGTSGPWDPSINPTFDYGRSDQQPPASVAVTAGEWVLVGHATGQVYADQLGLGPYGPDGYTDNWWGPDDGRDYTPGIHFPSRYIPTNQYPIYLMALLGAFADDSGAVVGEPFKIGSQSLTLLVPPGTSKLLLGVEDDRYADNSGSFTVEVAAAGVSISPGETVTNSIAAPLEVDRYKFSAEAGDKIMVRMAVLSGDLHARVAIHSSDGTRSQPSGY